MASPVPPSIQYPDRSSGLIVFGIIQILLGLLCALGIPLVLFSAFITRKTMGATMPAGSYVLPMVSYALLAAVLITLGVGSIRARRWAWALTLIASWIWLIVGSVVTVMLTAVLPAAFTAAMKTAGPNAAGAPRGVIAVVLTFVIVAIAIFLVIMPLAFLIFYRRADVRETCRRRDSQERWTDRCPLPVLAASLVFGYAVVYYLLMSLTAPIIPFFGRWLVGFPGGIACIFLAGLDTFLAISLYRLKSVGWWVTVVALVVRVISASITFLKGNLFEAYSRMGMPQKQLEMMNANPAMRSGVMLWSGLLFTIALLGYLVWIRRYFSNKTA